MICQPAAMMDAAANLHIAGNLRTGPSMFEAPTAMTALQFRHSPLDVPVTPKDTQSHVHRNGPHADVDNISEDFREALRTLSIDRDPISKSKQLFPDNRLDRITDAFKRGEKLLLSNDNARPKSRCKTPLSINSLHKVTPASDNDGSSLKSTNHLHTHISDDNMQKIFGEMSAPCLPAVKTDDSNNAHTGIAVGKQGHKNEKRQRKRAKTTVKTKKSKHGKISIPSTGMEKSSVNSQTVLQPTRRVSSEPLSKLSLSSVLSCAPTSFKSSHTASRMYPNSACNPIYRDLNSAPSSASKLSTVNNTQNVLHYTHSIATSDISNKEGALQAQGNTVQLHQTEFSRVKSGHSIRSVNTAENTNTNENVRKTASAPQSDFLSLNAKSCSLHPSLKTTSDSSVRRGSTSSNTTENTTKEAALTAIYGAVYQTANRVANQVEELKKAKKIFLSDRQSGTLKESGQEYPCAPPATPNPVPFVKVMFDDGVTAQFTNFCDGEVLNLEDEPLDFKQLQVEMDVVAKWRNVHYTAKVIEKYCPEPSNSTDPSGSNVCLEKNKTKRKNGNGVTKNTVDESNAKKKKKEPSNSTDPSGSNVCLEKNKTKIKNGNGVTKNTGEESHAKQKKKEQSASFKHLGSSGGKTKKYQPKTRPEVTFADYYEINDSKEIPDGYIPLAPGALIAVRSLWLHDILATLSNQRDRKIKKAARKGQTVQDQETLIIKRLVDGFFDPWDLAIHGGTSVWKENKVFQALKYLLRKYEYVPCMSDIRAQRAVKTRLQVMEKDAHKKKEKQKEVQAKLDKQQMKDREKILKLHQRREIYALNKIMTELENKRFLEFCNAKGLNKT